MRSRVLEINAEPAAAEYAQLIKAAPEELTPTVFAVNLVMARVGGARHVRAIQHADSDDSWAFDCILRRIEEERAGQSQQASEILRRHGGGEFPTYGEQFRYTHVTQPFTGVYVAEAEALP